MYEYIKTILTTALASQFAGVHWMIELMDERATSVTDADMCLHEIEKAGRKI